MSGQPGDINLLREMCPARRSPKNKQKGRMKEEAKICHVEGTQLWCYSAGQ